MKQVLCDRCGKPVDEESIILFKDKGKDGIKAKGFEGLSLSADGFEIRKGDYCAECVSNILLQFEA